MKKKTEGIVIIFALVGGLFFALRLPFLVYGGVPEIHADILLPRYTATPRPPEMAMTQQAFALLFFTPTSSAAPTDSFFAFLVPITGNTQTLTPTVTKTNTVTASPTRTLIPVFKTQTKVEEGGGGGSIPGSSQTPTKTQAVTLTPLTTSTQATSSPIPTVSNTPVLSTMSPTSPPATNTVPPPTVTQPPPTVTQPPPPTVTQPPPPTVTQPPPPTVTQPPPPTDVPTDPPPPPTETPGTGGNLAPDSRSTSARFLGQFAFLYILGGAVLGVVFRTR